MTHCFFISGDLHEPSGPGVADGDVRAWRDRHQCRFRIVGETADREKWPHFDPDEYLRTDQPSAANKRGT